MEAKKPKTPISTGKLQAVSSLFNIHMSFPDKESKRQP